MDAVGSRTSIVPSAKHVPGLLATAIAIAIAIAIAMWLCRVP